MSTGYTRNDTSNNIAEGNVIRASDLDGEFDALQTAFNSSSGHSHDGTSGEGGPITKLGPSQNVTVSASLLGPTSADDTIDLGTSSVQYKDLYIDGTAYIDGLGEDLLVATTAAIQFRDTDLSINSSTDGQLDIDADTELELTSPIVDINASTSVNISNDLKLDSDSAVLSLGADDDVTITHIPDTAVRVNDAIGVQFRDAALSINSSTDGQLDIDADAELEITAPIVDINASTSVNVSNDLKLDSDAAVLSMGADGEIAITHVHNTGLEVKTTGATANAVTDSLNLRVANASAVAGIGAGLTFTAETNAGNDETIAAIRAVTTDVTAPDGSAGVGEDADLAFHVMQAGTLTEAFRYDADDDELYVSGKLETTGDVTVGGALGITGGFTADTLTSKSTNTNLTLSGNGTGIVQVNDGLTVTGDLTVSGTTTTVNSTTVSIADANFELASTNNNDGSNGVTADAVDFGVYGNYNSDPGSANTTAYSGFFRDASDSGKLKFYTGLQAEPTTTVNTSGTGYAEATIVAGSVEVDNLTLNGNAITSTNTDGNITITPNGTGEVDITKVDIDSGAIDGTTIGANSAAAGTFSQVTLASGASVTSILDEDNFSSDSATALATQQSIKAYIASQTTASTPAGVIVPYAGTSAPTGYQFCNGQDLNTFTFKDLHAAISNTYGGTAYSAGVTDQSGVSTTFKVPDLRGRVIAGLDTMGSTTSQDRLTGQTDGVDGDTLGAVGGVEQQGLSTAQLPSHSHNILAVNSQVSDGTLSRVRSTTEGTGAVTRSTENEGSGQTHNNVQPTIILNYSIKT